MNIPVVMANLGYAIDFSYVSKNGDVVTFEFPKQRKKRWKMCCNSSGTMLFLIAANTGKMSEKKIASLSKQIKDACKMFTKWSDFEAAEASATKVTSKKIFVCGNARQIKYDSDKWTGKKQGYVHDFTSSPTVKIDDDDYPSIIIISGGKMRIRPEGIVK